ncbi:unnamed protein product [Ixodes pacificus]
MLQNPQISKCTSCEWIRYSSKQHPKQQGSNSRKIPSPNNTGRGHNSFKQRFINCQQGSFIPLRRKNPLITKSVSSKRSLLGERCSYGNPYISITA